MGVFKSLIGSLIGAAIATVIYYFLKPQNATSTLWFPILAGASTGIVSGIFGGSSRASGERLISGAISAVVAFVTMFGADVLLTSIDVPKLSKPLPAKSVEQKIAEKGVAPKSDGDTKAVTSDPQTTTEDNADKATGDNSSSEKSELAGTDEKADEDAKGVEPNREADDTDPAVSDSQKNETDINVRGPGSQQRVATPAELEQGAKMLADMERKRKINYWLQLIMPGIGILLAYQFARGFRDQPAEK